MSIKEKHDALYRRMMEMNKTELVFLERSINGAQPNIYKVFCIPSTRDRSIQSGPNLKISKETVARVMIGDLNELMNSDGAKKFCNIDEIQQKMDRVIINKQRYSISNIEINNFETIATFYLSMDE